MCILIFYKCLKYQTLAIQLLEKLPENITTSKQMLNSEKESKKPWQAKH